MNAWAKRGLQAAFFTGGVLALGAGIASANECCPDRPTPPLAALVSIPVRLCDNVIGAPGGPYSTPCIDETVSTDDLLAGSGAAGLFTATSANGPLAGSDLAGSGLAGPGLTDAGLAASDLGLDHVLMSAAALPYGRQTMDDLLRGNRGHLNLVVPFDVSGNAIAVANHAHASTTSMYAHHRPDPVLTDGSAGAVAGNVVAGDWVAPVALAGNAVSALGRATAESTTFTEASSGGDIETTGTAGPLSGNVLAPAFATPVQLSGNALAAPGGAAAASGSQSVAVTSGGDIETTGEGSALSGNVGTGPLALPVQFNDNAIAWGGRASTDAQADAQATAAGDATTDGTATQGSGNIAGPALAGPAAIAGNAISWIARAQTAGSADTEATAGGEYRTSGKHSMVSGNIASPAGAVSAQVLGNGAAWIGRSDGAHDDVTASAAGGVHSTAGSGGIGSGNLATAPVAGPAQLAGNAVSWIADTSADSSTDAQTTAGGIGATNGDSSVLGGGIGGTPVALPVQGFGNGVAWIGGAEAHHQNTVDADAGGASYTAGDSSLLGGPLASSPLAGPVDVFGNGGSWIGTASGDGTSTSSASAGGLLGTSGSDAIGGGEIAQVPFSMPTQGMGSGVSWIGDASGAASNLKTSTAGGPADSDDEGGVLSSNVASAPVAGPLEVFGNAVAWIAKASGAADSETTSTAGGPVNATGIGGFGSGNVAAGSLAMPGLVFGDAVSWIGRSDATTSADTTSTAGGSVTTDGSGGTLDGNAATPSFAGAAQVFGDAVSWIGLADAATTNETSAAAGGTTDTAGVDALLGGNVAQVPALGTAQPFGLAGALMATGYGAADSATAAQSGGPVTTDGTGSTFSGNIASLPLGALAQAFGDSVGAVGGLADATGGNATDALAGGDTTTAGGGFLNGMDLQLPAGTVLQPHDIPIELLGRAFTAAANATFMATGGNAPTVDMTTTGSDLPLTSGERSHAAGVPSISGLLPTDVAPGIEGLPLPGLDGAPGLDPLALPHIEGASLPSSGGLDLPAPDGSGLPALDGSGLPVLDGSGLPTLDGSGLPALDGGSLPALDGFGLPALDGSGLPPVGSLPPAPDLPDLDILECLPDPGQLLTPDGVPAFEGGGLPGLDGVGLPGLDGMGLPGLDGVSLPAVDGVGLPGLDGADLPGLDGVGMPGLGGGLPSLDGVGLPGLDGVSLPSVYGLGLSDLDGVGLPGLDGVDLPGLDGVGLPSPDGVDLPGVDGGALPGLGGVPGLDGLPESECLPGMDVLGGVFALPSNTGMGLSALDAVPGMDGVALPETDGLLPSVEQFMLPGLSGSPMMDGLPLPGIDGLSGVDPFTLPSLSGLPAVPGLPLPGTDVVPGVEGLPAVGALSLPGVDGLPGMDGLAGVDGLPGVDGLGLPGVDGAVVPNAPVVDGLPGVDECVAGAEALVSPMLRVLNGEGLPEAPAAPWAPRVTPMPMPVAPPDFGLLPTGDDEPSAVLRGLDELRELAMGIGGVIDVPTDQTDK